VPDAERLDPPLLPAGQRDEEAELDELLLGEVLVELAPQLVVCDLRVPDDGAGVAEGRLLPLAVPVRGLELEQVGVILFGEPLPSSLDGPLRPSVVALDRL
jgi:hypothetical protein